MRIACSATAAAAAALTVLIGTAGVTLAQSDVTVTATKVGGNVYLLTGSGGNVGVLTGEDGTFMIDDQFAPLTGQLLEAIRSIGGSAPRFLINTHYHGDHTGGNENLGKAGTAIFSHANVRKRLTTETVIEAFNMVSPPQPRRALPVVTFSSDLVFHLNGETVRALHMPAAHTDGDSIIHFTEANVIHAGDTWFNGFFPFVDTGNGGTLGGMLEAANTILALADAQTKIIPGHGPLGGRAELTEYRDMLVLAQTRLKALKTAGKSLQEVIAAQPLADLQARWGNAMFDSNRWIAVVWDGV